MSDVEWGSASDTGRVRSNNEDASLIREDLGLAVLCDGMGGHRAGEVASRIAVETFASTFEAVLRQAAAASGEGDIAETGGKCQDSPPGEQALLEAARAANWAVYAKAQSSPDFAGMGCTLVALHLKEDCASFVTVGDSRLYLLRGGTLSQISDDHTRLRMLERMGVSLESIDARRIRGVLTRAVGTHQALDVDCGRGQSAGGDLWLLCSDGLTDELNDDAIRSVLHEADNPRRASQYCVQRALEAGGRDNVSVVVAQLAGGPSPAGGVDLPKIRTLTL